VSKIPAIIKHSLHWNMIHWKE